MSGRNFRTEQTDFACENKWKRELAIAKSGRSYVGDADILVVSEKLICTTGEQRMPYNIMVILNGHSPRLSFLWTLLCFLTGENVSLFLLKDVHHV